MCIGGWIKAFDLGLVDAEDPYETVVTAAQADLICDYVSQATGGLDSLFFPDIIWDGINGDVAAAAITTFLETGAVSWASIKSPPRAAA